jgi:hypothetical protein
MLQILKDGLKAKVEQYKERSTIKNDVTQIKLPLTFQHHSKIGILLTS